MRKLLSLILSLVFVGAYSFSVNAQTEAALASQYASSCEFVKADFKTYIRPNDLKTRLDEARIYERIIKDQKSIYDRLKAHNQPRAGLKEAIDAQSNNLTLFKQSFEDYDDVLKKILALNCSTNSADLLSLVQSARQNRTKTRDYLTAQIDLTKKGLAAFQTIEPNIDERSQQ